MSYNDRFDWPEASFKSLSIMDARSKRESIGLCLEKVVHLMMIDCTLIWPYQQPDNGKR